MDAHHITDASKYVALLLLSLRTMLQMELPHINVLSKVDLLQTAGDLRASSASTARRYTNFSCSQRSTSTTTPKYRTWTAWYHY